MSDAHRRAALAPLARAVRPLHALLAAARASARERLPEPTAFALGTVGAGGPAVRAHPAAQGRGRARLRVLHQLREPKGTRAARASAGGDVLPLAAARAPGARRRAWRRTVSDEEADAYFATRRARQPDRRVGVAAEPADGARRARSTSACARSRRASRGGAGAASAALVGLPSRAGNASSSGTACRAGCTSGTSTRATATAGAPSALPVAHRREDARASDPRRYLCAHGDSDRRDTAAAGGRRLDDREGARALQHRRVGRRLLRHRRARPRRRASGQGASRATARASTSSRTTWRSRASRCRCCCASPTSCARASRR